MTEKTYKEGQEIIKEMRRIKASISIIDKIIISKNIECLVNSRDSCGQYETLGHSLKMTNCSELLINFLTMDKSTLVAELSNLEKQFELL